MATIKVCGIETEYGIHSPGPEQNPIAASSVLVNAYAADVEQQCFVVAVGRGFLVREDRIHVPARRLGAHHRNVDVVACERRGLHADAAREAVFAEVGAPRPGRDGDVDRVAFGRNAELFRADPDGRM